MIFVTAVIYNKCISDFQADLNVYISRNWMAMTNKIEIYSIILCERINIELILRMRT